MMMLSGFVLGTILWMVFTPQSPGVERDRLEGEDDGSQ